MKKIISILLVVMGAMSPLLVNCDMVSPDNTTYRIYADAVDGGGALSDGGIYDLEDTVGESIATSTSGGVYNVRGGYQAMTSSSISMTISDGSLDLGNLSLVAVNTADATVTITTDDVSGYALSVGSVAWGANVLSDVGGGHVVVAGVEAYGFAAAGGDSQLVGDWAVTAGQSISASSTPVYDSATTLTFKATIDGGSVAGAYTQTVILQASVNLGL